MLLTAFREEALADRALAEAGIQAILGKPFEIEDFAQAVDEALAP
jgi:CheY-like chemotaxis protein